MAGAFNGRGRRTVGQVHGFTLAEILIALALIAILAAVLLPTVAGQILKGDAGRVMQDLEAVRSGADQFLADVHRYPGKVSDLTTKITTAKTDINGNTYTSGLVSKWSGPYITKDTLNAVVLTGFGGSIQNGFKIDTASNAVRYLTVVILGIAQPDFERIDVQLDGSVTLTSGLLKFRSDSTLFLATPIQ